MNIYYYNTLTNPIFVPAVTQKWLKLYTNKTELLNLKISSKFRHISLTVINMANVNYAYVILR